MSTNKLKLLTEFDVQIQKNLERIFLSLEEEYKKNDGFLFQFINAPVAFKVKDEKFKQFNLDSEENATKVNFIYSKLLDFLNNDNHFKALKYAHLTDRKAFDKIDNLEELKSLIKRFRKFYYNLGLNLFKQRVSQIYPFKEHLFPTDLSLLEIYWVASSVNRDNYVEKLIKTTHLFDLYLTEIEKKDLIEDLSKEFWPGMLNSEDIDYAVEFFFVERNIYDSAKDLFKNLFSIEYWERFQKYLYDAKETFDFLEIDYAEIPRQTFNPSDIKSKLPYESLKEEDRHLAFPSFFDQSYNHLEHLPFEIIITYQAYIIYFNPFKSDFPINEIGKPWMIDKIEGQFHMSRNEFVFNIWNFILTKIHYFEEHLNDNVNKLCQLLPIENINRIKCLEYLGNLYSKIKEDSNQKIKVLEGIKFSMEITDFYVDSLLNIVLKKINIENGELLNYVVDSDFLNLELEPDNRSLMEVFLEQNEFYYEYKLYWDSQKNGDIKEIFYELNNSKYNTNGKPYMEIKDIDRLIERTFSIKSGEVPFDRNRIGLKYNKSIGTIRHFLYYFKERYYKDEPEEKFAQILRDNFSTHYNLQKFDPSFETLKRIASNMHKGAKPVINLPPRKRT